jgi:ATP-dependent RNA helicase RhlE
MQFEELNLNKALLKAVSEQGYTEPTPIQVQAIPHVLAERDLIGLAQTGTGKTAAFALPILHHLTQTHRKKSRDVRALILAPTRELAAQIGDSFKAYGTYTPIKHVTIFGGVSQRPQVDKIKRGAQVVVATPGRLLDLMNQRLIKLDKIDVLILDEADRMLDMGFMPDIKRIVKTLPTQRQTLLFSADRKSVV